tara:strand:+ start:509 stop:682 length:174 start_codon:yes stop_codon:yes gene_type:complete
MDKTLTLGKRLNLVERIRFYKMMLHSRKGLCGWEIGHWEEKLKIAEDHLKDTKNNNI